MSDLELVTKLDPLRLEFHLRVEETAPGWRPSSTVGISASDLAYLAQLADQVSDAVAEQAMWRLLLELGASDTFRLGFFRHVASSSKPFSPAQISHLGKGSIEIGLELAPGLIVGWFLKDFFGNAIKEGWEESVWRQRVVEASRTMFGGSLETVERTAAESPAPPNIAVQDVSWEVHEDAASTLRVIANKFRSAEVHALGEVELFLESEVKQEERRRQRTKRSRATTEEKKVKRRTQGM